MADPKQRALLKKSFMEWSKWRRAHPDVTVNLSGSYLRRAIVSRANIREASLLLIPQPGMVAAGPRQWQFP